MRPALDKYSNNCVKFANNFAIRVAHGFVPVLRVKQHQSKTYRVLCSEIELAITADASR
jgi:hypothetical protein